MAFVDGTATATVELSNAVTPSALLTSGASAAFEFVASGDLVRPIAPASVLLLDSETLRVDFSGPLSRASELTRVGNYSITTSTPGAVAPAVRNVLVPDVEAPDFLILQISEMTHGASYSLSASGILGANGVVIAADAISFTGLGIAPTPGLVVATSPTTARIDWSERMKLVGDLANAAAYTFSGGLLVDAVIEVGTSHVLLRTSEQDPDTLYTVTITGVFKDTANNIMPSPTSTAMLGFQPQDVPEKILRLRAYRFLTEVIRLEDQRRGGKFVERFLEGPQKVWEKIHSSIFSLPILWDVENVPDRFLKFLKHIVGWTRSLDEITDALDADTLRRLIAASVAFWKSRGPEDAIEAILRLTTGARLRLLNWFDFRWISDETHLGWEWGSEGDPWVVSDYTSQERGTVTLAGVSALSSATEIAAMPIEAGVYDSLVVFVLLNSSNINLARPPVYRSETGAESPMLPLGLVTSATQNNVGRLALSAWMLNGLKGDGGELDVKPAAMGSNGVGEPVVRVIARTCLGLDRRRNIQFTSNGGEGSVSFLGGGVRALQDLDPILVAVATSPAGSAPTPIAPMVADSAAGAAGGTLLSTGYFAGSKGGDAFGWGIDGPASQALTAAIALAGKESAREVSGDEVVYQIRIVDDGTLNKNLVRALARLTRPVGERVDILYLGFLDLFQTEDDVSQWTTPAGTAVVDGGSLKLSDGAMAELSYASVAQASAWSQYVVHARMRITSAAPDLSTMELGAYYADEDNRYYARIALSPGAGPSTPSDATVSLRKVVSGVDSLVGSASFPDMFRGVFYTITIEIARDTANNQNEIRVLIDGDVALNVVDAALEQGSISVGHPSGSGVEVDAVEMHFLPAATDFVGLATNVSALPLVPTIVESGPTPTPASCPVPTSLNKNMSALATAAEGALACSQPIALTPVGHVSVDVNGLGVPLGDGVKSSACYFSSDGGATAKPISSIAAGDSLYWNGTIAGYQLEAGWRIDFNYNVS